jgi:hypothetical protein
MKEFDITATLTVSAEDYDTAEDIVIDVLESDPVIEAWHIHPNAGSIAVV